MRKAYINVCVTSYCKGCELGRPIPWGCKYCGLAIRLGKYRMWDSKIWCVPRDSNPILTSLARTNSSCKRQTCFFIEYGGQFNKLTTNSTKNLSWAPDDCLAWQQEKLAVSRNITWTFAWPSSMVLLIDNEWAQWWTNFLSAQLHPFCQISCH